MRALVTGPRGFVGARIMDELAGEAIPAPSLRNACEEDIRRIVDAAQPDVIIHTAAMSDISDCANDPGGSYRANGSGSLKQRLQPFSVQDRCRKQRRCCSLRKGYLC